MSPLYGHSGRGYLYRAGMLPRMDKPLESALNVTRFIYLFILNNRVSVEEINGIMLHNNPVFKKVVDHIYYLTWKLQEIVNVSTRKYTKGS